MSQAAATGDRHPPGLKVLFFTELWERFGFYLMLGIFTLYMVEPITGVDPSKDGLGFTKERSSDVYGTYIALVYFTPFLGGLLADRLLGYRLSITIGGLLFSAGYFVLAVPGETAVYIGLALLIAGNGLFKPNISTLVGKLYPAGSPLRDSGYNIFYMGINIGAFVCNFVAAILRNKYGWGWAFAAAGVGMLIGLITFWTFQKQLVGAEDRAPVKDQTRLAPVFLFVILPALAFGALGYFLGDKGHVTVFGSASTTAFVFSIVPVIAYYVNLWVRAPVEEKAPIGALLSIFGVVIVFWMIFHQNGSALTFWAEENTDRAAGPVLTSALDATYMGARVEPDSPYFHNVPPAERPPREISVINPELFQSINPFFVVLLSPLVVWCFSAMRRRALEPSTPAKIGWGLFITAISTLPMIAAVMVSSDGQVKASPWWLVGTYGIITLGELCLSPMGLSLVSKLSPKRIAALMMGGWFVATSFGNKLAGVISGLWEKLDSRTTLFGINGVSALAAGLAIFLMVPWLRRVMREHAGEGKPAIVEPKVVGRETVPEKA
jgi:POT family proton-dependent oligopeptide transporter